MQDNSSNTISINDNEDRYRILVELSPDAMMLTTRGKVVYANSAAIEMWEASDQSDLVGMAGTELVRSDYRDLSGQRQSEITAGDIDVRQSTSESIFGESTNPVKLATVEFVIQTLKGREKYVESSGTVALVNGEPSAIFVVRDISQRKKLEDALQKSEANAQAFVRAIPDLLFRVNREGVILDAKVPHVDELVETTGQRIGKTLHQLMPRDVADAWMDSITRALVTHEVQTLHYELQIEDISRVREARVVANGFDEAVVISRDVTENKRFEEDLKRSETRYRRLVETVPHGIEENDVSGVIQYANSAHHKQYGYNDGEMIGMSVWDLVATDSEREELRAYLQYLAENQPPPSLYTGTRKTASGKIVDVEIAWNYNKEEDQVTGFTSVITDVTERNIAQEALRNSEARSLKLADQMAAVAEIGRVINSSLEIDEVYARFADELKKILTFDWVTLSTIDLESGTATLRFQDGAEIPGLPMHTPVPSEGTFVRTVAEAGYPIHFEFNDVAEISEKYPGMRLLNAGARSAIGVPLIYRGRVIAVYQVVSKQLDAYTSRDVELATPVGYQITGAIANSQVFAESREDNSRLSTQLEANAAEMAVVDEVAKIVASTTEIERVFDRFALEVKKLMDFDGIGIADLDLTTNSYNINYLFNVRTVDHFQTSQSLKGSYPEEVLRTGKSILRRDIREAPKFDMDGELVQRGVRSMLPRSTA